jgi:hypothetical protein
MNRSANFAAPVATLQSLQAAIAVAQLRRVRR